VCFSSENDNGKISKNRSLSPRDKGTLEAKQRVRVRGSPSVKPVGWARLISQTTRAIISIHSNFSAAGYWVGRSSPTNVRNCKFAFGVVASCFLISCQFTAKLEIKPGSSATHLVFSFTGGQSGDAAGRLKSAQVNRCKREGNSYPLRGELVWSVYVPSGKEPPVVEVFAYGQTIVGLETADGPAALTGPGCYIASAYGDFPDPRLGVIVFYVSSDGKTIDMNPPANAASPPSNQIGA
jgi:hypothetical protein